MDATFSNRTVWEHEWATSDPGELIVPGQTSLVPSPAIVKFIDFLKDTHGTNVKQLDCIDIGCGAGRNTFYLSDELHFVTGVDYAQSSIDHCNALLAASNIGNVTLQLCDFTETTPIESESYDIAIDSLTSTSIYGEEARAKFANNIRRVLRRGGLLLLRAVSVEDEFEQELMREHPGPEPNSSIWPGTYKFQKNFTLEELLNMFSGFDPIVVEQEIKQAIKMGKEFTATNWWIVLQKGHDQE